MSPNFEVTFHCFSQTSQLHIITNWIGRKCSSRIFCCACLESSFFLVCMSGWSTVIFVTSLASGAEDGLVVKTTYSKVGGCRVESSKDLSYKTAWGCACGCRGAKPSSGWCLPWLSPGCLSSAPTPPPGGRRQREPPRNTPPPGCWWTSRKALPCVRRPPSLAWQRKSCRRRSGGCRGTEWLKVSWAGRPAKNKHSVCCYLLFQECSFPFFFCTDPAAVLAPSEFAFIPVFALGSNRHNGHSCVDRFDAWVHNGLHNEVVTSSVPGSVSRAQHPSVSPLCVMTTDQV